MKPWRSGETRTFQYIARSKPTPEGAIVIGWANHHDTHSILVELPSRSLPTLGDDARGLGISEGSEDHAAVLAMPTAPALLAPTALPEPLRVSALSGDDPYRKRSVF